VQSGTEGDRAAQLIVLVDAGHDAADAIGRARFQPELMLCSRVRWSPRTAKLVMVLLPAFTAYSR
jgi:hypothetical protein